MLKSHTYLSLATNWQPPSITMVAPEMRLQTTTVEDWGAIVVRQQSINIVLDEADVSKARKDITQKAATMRESQEVEPDQECRVCVEVVAESETNLRLTTMSFQSMAELHTSSRHLQAFRCAVTWLKEVASNSNTRVPPMCNDERSKLGLIGTELIEKLLPSGPASIVWTLGTVPAGNRDEDFTMPAHLLIKNMGETWMFDDVITMNALIIQRWCHSSHAGVHIIQCSFFERLLKCPVDGIAALVEKLHGEMRAEARLAGVCNRAVRTGLASLSSS